MRALRKKVGARSLEERNMDESMYLIKAAHYSSSANDFLSECIVIYLHLTKHAFTLGDSWEEVLARPAPGTFYTNGKPKTWPHLRILLSSRQSLFAFMLSLKFSHLFLYLRQNFSYLHFNFVGYIHVNKYFKKLPTVCLEILCTKGLYVLLCCVRPSDGSLPCRGQRAYMSLHLNLCRLGNKPTLKG